MTWRAFFVGLVAVVVIAVIAPWNDFYLGNTYITGNHFPPGPFFLLLFLTLGANVLIKLINRRWALKQSELMLVWCMMIISATVPASGLGRFLFSMQAAPAYYADAPDLPNQSEVLEEVPESLVLTKDPRSVAAEDFFEGQPELDEPRIYFSRWIRPLASWLLFVGLFYLATFFLTSVFRKQWVEVERLIFPLARVPLELTQGSANRELLPALFRSKAFVWGLAISLVFAVVRAGPVIFGAASGWLPSVNVQQFLWDTPLAQMAFGSAYLFPIAVGIAFLVPADVALSVWLFFIFTRLELQSAYWIGRPITGGTYGVFMQWQQAGAFIVFTIMMFWAARRHLWAVLKKALWIDSSVDDSAEPISYRVSFWGLLLALGGIVGWYGYYGMSGWRIIMAVALVGLMFCIVLVHARLVSQGGIFFTQHTWRPPMLLHSVTGGQAFSSVAAVVAQMQNAILLQDAREILSGHAMNAFRITSVFEKRKRLFLPIMLVVLAVAVGFCTFSTLRMYYEVGGFNIPNTYGTVSLPKTTFQQAGRMITDASGSAEPHFGALGLGGVIMFFLTVMRARFYWWPVHSLGFLIGSTWPAQNLWFPFLLGWMAKVFIMKFGGGAMLRKTRSVFMGVIIGESIAIGVSTLLGLLAGIKLGFIFLPG
jgi:hypothetical protein